MAFLIPASLIISGSDASIRGGQPHGQAPEAHVPALRQVWDKGRIDPKQHRIERALTVPDVGVSKTGDHAKKGGLPGPVTPRIPIDSPACHEGDAFESIDTHLGPACHTQEDLLSWG